MTVEELRERYDSAAREAEEQKGRLRLANTREQNVPEMRKYLAELQTKADIAFNHLCEAVEKAKGGTP